MDSFELDSSMRIQCLSPRPFPSLARRFVLISNVRLHGRRFTRSHKLYAEFVRFADGLPEGTGKLIAH